VIAKNPVAHAKMMQVRLKEGAVVTEEVAEELLRTYQEVLDQMDDVRRVAVAGREREYDGLLGPAGITVAMAKGMPDLKSPGKDDGSEHGVCFAYARNGTCKYGVNCKYRHPADKGNAENKRSSPGKGEGKGKSPRICYWFNTAGGCKKGKDCPYEHREKEETSEKKNETQRPTASVVFIGMSKVTSHVLVDTGANEVVRPYNQSWWNEIMNGKPGTHFFEVGLAGGLAGQGAMTQYGEVMVRCKSAASGWICPVSRVVRELGMKFEWGKAGAKLVDTDGTVVPAVYDDGLMYLTWEAFQPIRSRLIENHKGGRPMC
jgi:hypothetical protein